MNPSPNSHKLSPATSAFVLAAAITVLFNTALAWAKDLSAPLTAFMKSLTGHHWTTHGLADLVVFLGLGLIIRKMNAAATIGAGRLTNILIGAVAIAAMGLALWFAFF